MRVANKKLISSDCYRLLSLVPDVQNDVEILKPVLEELEVMRLSCRLSCRLGMLSSVNPKDFEMETLEAREFDDNFALFLRNEIFRADEKKLKAVDDMFDKSLQAAIEQSKDQVTAEIEAYRAKLQRHLHKLLSLDVLIEAAKTDPAFMKLNEIVQEAQLNRSSRSEVDAITRERLTLPLRVKNKGCKEL